MRNLLTALTLMIGTLLTSTTASAQEANCDAARTPRMRAWCYQQRADIYREQAQRDSDNARQLWQDYRNAPKSLKVDKIIQAMPLPPAQKLEAKIKAKIAVPAATWGWNQPGNYYERRYGRPSSW